jgi:hypothetical protein
VATVLSGLSLTPLRIIKNKRIPTSRKTHGPTRNTAIGQLGDTENNRFYVCIMLELLLDGVLASWDRQARHRPPFEFWGE